MTIMENPIKTRLKAGKPVLGTWSIISSPVVVEIFALAGFDFLILDMEHGIYDQTALDACIRACESAGCSPIVRVPSVVPYTAQWAMDLGAHGVVVPQIDGAASAQTAVRMTKFSPAGTRGYNPFTRAALYANPPRNQTGKLSNDFGLTAIIVENQSALDELDDILAIDNLDVIYVGVYDLSVVLGCDGDTRHSRIQKVLEETVARVKAAGKTAGIMVRNRQDVTDAIALGAHFLVHAVDTLLVYEAAQHAVRSFSQGVNAGISK
jgi:4-hydroxy-2-oxoheptanedioate aldolase